MFDSSPGLIAACHVLHRLITPRHPPYTLSSLITFITGPKHRTHDKRPKPPQLSCPPQGKTFLQRTSVNLQSCYPYELVKEPRPAAAGPSDPCGVFNSPAPSGASKAFYDNRRHQASAFSNETCFFPHARPKHRLDMPWRRPGSNRQPLACKASALPIELRPQLNCRSQTPGPSPGAPVTPVPKSEIEWARLESNQRPHPYQGCALTS